MQGDTLTHPSALDLALRDLEAASSEVRRLEEQLATARQRQRRIREAVDSLAAVNDVSEETQRRMDEIIGSPKPDAIEQSSEPVQALLNKLMTSPETYWKVEEIQRFLDDGGYGVSSKYASNTMRKLQERGLLRRVGRGIYQVNDQRISMMGHSQEDYDE